MRWSAENAAAAIALAVAGTSSWSPGAEGLITIFPVAVTWKRASCGLRETAAESRSRYCLGAAAGDRDGGRAAARAARAAARSASAAPASASRRRRAGSAPRARFEPASQRRRGRRLDLRLGGRERERDRASRGRSRRERCDDGRGGRSAVELPARSCPRRPGCRAPAHELRVDALAVDAARDLGELVVDGSVVGAGPAARRRRRRTAPAGA